LSSNVLPGSERTASFPKLEAGDGGQQASVQAQSVVQDLRLLCLIAIVTDPEHHHVKHSDAQDEKRALTGSDSR